MSTDRDISLKAQSVGNEIWSAKQDDSCGLRITLKKDSGKEGSVQTENDTLVFGSNSDEELSNVNAKKSETSFFLSPYILYSSRRPPI